MSMSLNEAIKLAEESITEIGLGGFRSHPSVPRMAMAELIIAAKKQASAPPPEMLCSHGYPPTVRCSRCDE